MIQAVSQISRCSVSFLLCTVTKYIPTTKSYSKITSVFFLQETSVVDPGCLSRIRIFSIPNPGSASKILSIVPQKLFLSSRKYDPDCSSRILNFTHPGSRDQKGTGSRIQIRNTVENLTWLPRGVLGGIGLLSKVGFPLGVMLMAKVIDLGVMLPRPGFLMGVMTPWLGFPLGVMSTTDLVAWQGMWVEDISLSATGSNLTALTSLPGWRSFICFCFSEKTPGAAGTTEPPPSTTGCIPGIAAATWFFLSPVNGRIFLADGTGKEAPAPTEDLSAVCGRLLLLTEASSTEVITSTGAWGMPLMVVRSLLLDGNSWCCCCCWFCRMLGLDFWASNKAPTTDFQTLFRWGVGAVVGRGRGGVEEETTGLWQRDPSPSTAAGCLLVMTASLAWKTENTVSSLFEDSTGTACN